VTLEALLPVVGFGGLALTIVSWLAITLGGSAAKLSWVGATGLYGALLALFVSLFQSAFEDGSLTRMFLFGFLLVMFASGFVVAVWRTAEALSGGTSAGEDHAAH
jgi:hypothetical protein